MIWLVLLGILVCGLLFSLVREHWESERISHRPWNELTAMLDHTDTGGITVIALEFRNPGQRALVTTAHERFSAIGGWRGLMRMRSNAKILIALAAQAEHWRPGETKHLVEEMRREAVFLRRAPLLIALQRLSTRRTTYVQRSATAYWRMMSLLTEIARDQSPERLQTLNTAIWQN